MRARFRSVQPLDTALTDAVESVSTLPLVDTMLSTILGALSPLPTCL